MTKLGSLKSVKNGYAYFKENWRTIVAANAAYIPFIFIYKFFMMN